MINLIFQLLLFRVTVSPPPSFSLDLDFFIVDLDKPTWHFLFRLVFGMGLAVVLLVYLYYRNRNKRR
jgi:hypothetical protein